MKKNMGLLLMGFLLSGWGMGTGAAATIDPRHSPPGFSHQSGYHHPGSNWVGGVPHRVHYPAPYYHSYRPHPYVYRTHYPRPYPGASTYPYRAYYHPPSPRFRHHPPPGFGHYANP